MNVGKIGAALGLGLGFIVLVVLLSFMGWCGQQASKVAAPAVERYEEFQSMYNAAEASYQKMCQIERIPADDKMFDLISKAAQLQAQQSILTRWINEYNAKSKMWTRSVWKGGKLPYELSASSFNCP